MNNINPLIFGAIALVLIFLLKGRIPYIGELPGDIEMYGNNWHLFLPITSGLLMSLVLSFLLGLFRQH